MNAKPYLIVNFPCHIEDSVECDFKELPECIDVHHTSSVYQSAEVDTFLLHVPQKLIKSDLKTCVNTSSFYKVFSL